MLARRRSGFSQRVGLLGVAAGQLPGLGRLVTALPSCQTMSVTTASVWLRLTTKDRALLPVGRVVAGGHVERGHVAELLRLDLAAP